ALLRVRRRRRLLRGRPGAPLAAVRDGARLALLPGPPAALRRGSRLDRDTAAAQDRRMVKLVFLCRRRPDITHERYAELLLRGHVPLALRHHPTLRRYVVNIVEDTRGPAPPLDSIGELWFDTLADYRERLYDSPAGAGIIARD